MQVDNFTDACKKAEELAAFVQNRESRVAAFQVALDRLLCTPAMKEKQGILVRKPAPQDGNGNEVKSETQRRILELRDAGFFQEPRLPTEVRTELRTQGYHHNPTDVRMALLRLARKKQLRRLEDGGKHYRYAVA